jgi:hypothetical protein
MAINMRILGAFAAGFALCGCASTAGNTTSKPAASTAQNQPFCLTDTGSRLPPGKDGCRGIGRSFTDEDISRTGKTNAGDALSQLDPSITVHH